MIEARRPPLLRAVVGVGLLALVALALSADLGRSLVRTRASLAHVRLILADAPHERRDDEAASPYLAGVRAFYAGEFATAVDLLAQAPPRGGLTRWFTLRAQVEGGLWRETLAQLDLGVEQERALFVELLAAHEAEMTPDVRAQALRALAAYPEEMLVYVNKLFSARRFAEGAALANSIVDPLWQDEAHLAEARAHFYLRDWGAARALLDGLADDAPSPLALYWLGRTRYEQGEIEAGLRNVKDAIEALPAPARPQYLAAYAPLLARAGQCPAAESLLYAAVETDAYAAQRALLDDALAWVRDFCE